MGGKRKDKPAEDEMSFLLKRPQNLSCYPEVLPTVGVGLPISIQVIRTLLQVKLPAQGILICDKLTLKPTTIPAIRWCHSKNGVPGK